jgi:hypothetical protein
MSTKKSHQEAKEKSLLLNLENAVLALESANYTEQDIFSFVNMVMKGFIRDGAFAPEYVAHVEQIIMAKKQEEQEARDLALRQTILGER